MIVSFPCSAAVVKFTDTKLSVSEPGTVEVFVELIGALSFDIDVMVEVDFKTTTGIFSNTNYYKLTVYRDVNLPCT